jgi:hypothetical protein
VLPEFESLMLTDSGEVATAARAYSVALLPADIARGLAEKTAPRKTSSRNLQREDLLILLRECDAACLAALNRLRSPGADDSDQADSPAEVRYEGLTDLERTVLKIISDRPKGAGLSGKEIVARLKRFGIDVTESTLRRHVIPQVKSVAGVRNSPSRGGYHLPD